MKQVPILLVLLTGAVFAQDDPDPVKLLTDLAALLARGHRIPDDSVSVSSSLITNESGSSSSSMQRPALQIPVMPSGLELAAVNPRMWGQDIDIHVHAVFPPEEPPETNSSACGRQLS